MQVIDTLAEEAASAVLARKASTCVRSPVDLRCRLGKAFLLTEQPRPGALAQSKRSKASQQGLPATALADFCASERVRSETPYGSPEYAGAGCSGRGVTPRWRCRRSRRLVHRGS